MLIAHTCDAIILSTFHSIGVDNRAMKMWYLTYQDFLSMPVLKSHVYLMPSLPEIEEAKFNVMHTTFAIIHTFTELNKNELNEGQKSFAILFERFFKEDLQVCTCTKLILHVLKFLRV